MVIALLLPALVFQLRAAATTDGDSRPLIRLGNEQISIGITPFGGTVVARCGRDARGRRVNLGRPSVVAARPANGLLVSHVELRLHRDLAYEVSDLVVAASLAEAWSP